MNTLKMRHLLVFALLAFCFQVQAKTKTVSHKFTNHMDKPVAINIYYETSVPKYRPFRRGGKWQVVRSGYKFKSSDKKTDTIAARESKVISFTSPDVEFEVVDVCIIKMEIMEPYQHIIERSFCGNENFIIDEEGITIDAHI